MWKDIPGWENNYECNEFGQIRNKTKGNIRAQADNGLGYMKVTLYDKQHMPPKQKFYIHRLVATLFLDNPNKYPEVDHKDFDTTNNHVDNLEWVSRVENEIRSHKYGAKKYKPFVVQFNDGSLKEYDSCGRAAEDFNCTRGAVCAWLKNLNRGYSNHGIQKIYYKQ